MAGFRSNTVDMTEGDPGRLILSFAVPLFIGNVFQMFYNVVDSMVVGRFVGTHALAAVGGAGSSYNIMIALIMGFTSGSSVMISQAYGSGDEKRMRRGYVTSFAVIMLSGVIFTIMGEVLARPLLLLLKTPADVIAEAETYIRVMFAGILATALYNSMSSYLRALGNSLVPLAALIAASVLNVALDLVFVIVFHWDVAGVAAATVLSQAVSGIFCFIYIRRRIPALKVKRSDLTFDAAAAKELLRLGVPAAFSTAVVTMSVMLVQRAVNHYGSTVMAAYTASNKAENVCFCLSYAIGLATGVFVGQNKGAQRFDRVRAGLWAGIRISLIYQVAMGLVLYFAGPLIIGLFTTGAEVIEIGTEIVHITACFAPVLGLVFIFQHFLRSVSDVRPTVYMSCAEILSRGVMPYVLAAGFGYRGIWWATPIGWCLSLLIGALRYKSGKWKEK